MPPKNRQKGRFKISSSGSDLSSNGDEDIVLHHLKVFVLDCEVNKLKIFTQAMSPHAYLLSLPEDIAIITGDISLKEPFVLEDVLLSINTMASQRIEFDDTHLVVATAWKLKPTAKQTSARYEDFQLLSSANVAQTHSLAKVFTESLIHAISERYKGSSCIAPCMSFHMDARI